MYMLMVRLRLEEIFKVKFVGRALIHRKDLFIDSRDFDEKISTAW